MLTNNRILIEKLEPLPALMCAQRRAEKCIPTEEDFIRSNINSFGNEIGQTTNWITSMFEVQAQFPEDSKEYLELDYRIKCGQLYQQNAIDKAKGIVCKPMPRSWHDRYEAGRIKDEEIRDFYRSIVADKKPYFMCYIYPTLMKQYKNYIKKVNSNSLRRFGLSLDDLLRLDESSLDEEKAAFVKYYNYSLPVGTNDCIMNKICRRFEEEFDGIISKKTSEEIFDYTVMKSTTKYKLSQYYKIMKIYEEYNQKIRSLAIVRNDKKLDLIERQSLMSTINHSFIKDCSSICSNEDELCNIVLDMCYRKKSTKRFAWTLCSSIIVRNLLERNEYTIQFPQYDCCGDIDYSGNKFKIVKKKVGVKI